MSTQDRLDEALALVATATQQLLGRAGGAEDVLADAHRLLEIQDLLEEAGAQPGADVVAGKTAQESLAAAEARLDAIEAQDRPVRLAPARLELRAAAAGLGVGL